jgi:putative oxidoreductase
MSLKNLGLWVLQIGAAGMFLMAGSAKLSGDPMMVATFEKVGLGQWFRYLTGTLEVGGGLGLLIPSAAGPSALVLFFVMAGAVLSHLLILGGSATPALVLVVSTGLIAWSRRESIVELINALVLALTLQVRRESSAWSR